MQNHDDWYIARDEQQVGPLTGREMHEFVWRGHLRPDDLVWRSGFDDWQLAADLLGFQGPPTRSAAWQVSEKAGRSDPHTNCRTAHPSPS